MSRIIFPLIIFCSAFLLFQIQPMLSKEQLALFGGGASVWTTSLLFYQGALLCGYVYAFVITRLPLNQQLYIHISLLLMACCITFYPDEWHHVATADPVQSVIWNLSQQIGLVFMLLSATSILLQHWYSKAFNKSVPYTWYGWSNWGSLLALLSYPLLVEFYFSISEQKHYWLLMLFVFTALFFSCGVYFLKSISVGLSSSSSSQQEYSRDCLTTAEKPVNNDVLSWLAFSACSSLCLVATTHAISTNIPPMPLVWNLPLALYLLSFALAFSSYSLFFKKLSHQFLLFVVVAGVLMTLVGSQFNTTAQLSAYCFILVICCLMCHCQLKALAPEPRYMPLFYLCMAAGGVFGSLFSTLVAPHFFDQLTEYPLSLFAVLGLFLWLQLHRVNLTRHQLMGGGSMLMVILFIGTAGVTQLNGQYTVASARNFYGYVAVKDINTERGKERRLVDGTTIHGSQQLDVRELDSATYYHPQSGVVSSLAVLQQQTSLSLGIIGLGVGALAQYGEREDSFTFYELNPAVYQFASSFFSYLENSKAKIDVVIGDGRLSLRNEDNLQKQLKNALIIDAFSSDVIPMHLLTEEAFDLYWRRMTSDGVILIHISNNHVDLMPILQAHSFYSGKSLLTFDNSSVLMEQGNKPMTQWVAITDNQTFLTDMSAKYRATIHNFFMQPSHVWTDDKHSLLPLLKL